MVIIVTIFVLQHQSSLLYYLYSVILERPERNDKGGFKKNLLSCGLTKLYTLVVIKLKPQREGLDI